MSEFKQKAWTATDEALEQIEQISRSIGNQNMSATIRYCVQEVFKNLSQKEAS